MRIFVCLVALAIAGIPESARAQSGSFGLKGGLLMASLSTDGTGSFETSAEAGIGAGAFAAIELGGIARLQPEVMTTEQRFSISTAGADIKGRAIEVPVLLHLRFGKDRRVHPVLFAGPRIGFISKVTQATALGDTDISKNIADVDAGVTFGAGFEVAARRGAVVVDARFSVGLKDLSETGSPALKSRAFLLLAGYRF